MFHIIPNLVSYLVLNHKIWYLSNVLTILYPLIERLFGYLLPVISKVVKITDKRAFSTVFPVIINGHGSCQLQIYNYYHIELYDLLCLLSYKYNYIIYGMGIALYKGKTNTGGNKMLPDDQKHLLHHSVVNYVLMNKRKCEIKAKHFSHIPESSSDNDEYVRCDREAYFCLRTIIKIKDIKAERGYHGKSAQDLARIYCNNNYENFKLTT